MTPGLPLLATLSLEAATGPGGDRLPPLRVPLRFFVTAPVFGMLAGALWCADGEAAFATRWAPAMLGATHLLVLGFFTMVMFGALFQVVPVLGGQPIPRAETTGRIVHAALAGGALLLAAGLWTGGRALLIAALPVLGIAFLVFAPALAVALRARAAALVPVRFAAAGFAGTAALGFLLVAAIAWPSGLDPLRWTNLHAAWGGLGWGLLLVIGVGHQVVPMFHVTPPYPPRLSRATAPAIVLGLVLLAPGARWATAGLVLIAAAGLLHVAVTLRLLARRRRRRADPTVRGWQLGLAAVGVALLLALLEAVLPGPARPLGGLPEPERLIAVLFGFGGLGTIVLGMLVKIVPFLSFLHLQRRCLPAAAAIAALPPMDRIVSGRAAFAQVLLHAAAAAAVAAAVIAPGLARLAGALVIADFGWCLALVVTAGRRHRRAAAAIDRLVAAAR